MLYGGVTPCERSRVDARFSFSSERAVGFRRKIVDAARQPRYSIALAPALFRRCNEAGNSWNFLHAGHRPHYRQSSALANISRGSLAGRYLPILTPVPTDVAAPVGLVIPEANTTCLPVALTPRPPMAMQLQLPPEFYHCLSVSPLDVHFCAYISPCPLLRRTFHL